ncbi:MAG: glycosyltransferase family 9 protein [Dehalococcoidia bacterium]
MTWPGDLARILLVRLDNLGDVVLLAPAVEALHARSPRVRLTLLASPGGAGAAALLPAIDEVIVHRPVWQELTPGRESASAEQALIQDLRVRQFDAAVIFTSFAQSALPAAFACFLAGIPLRAAYGDRFAGRVLTDEVVPPSAPLHEADRNLQLLQAIGISPSGRALRIEVPDAAQAAADAALASLRMSAPFILLAPGASAPARRYPARHFAEVAGAAAEAGLSVLVTGSQRERALLESVVDGAGHPDVCGIVPADVPMLAGLVRRAGAAVSNNSLTMHLADAFRVPAVVLYSGTDLDAHWRPRFAAARLLRRPVDCAPCHGIECVRALQCLDIPPSRVVAALQEMLRPRATRAVHA